MKHPIPWNIDMFLKGKLHFKNDVYSFSPPESERRMWSKGGLFAITVQSFNTPKENQLQYVKMSATVYK